MNIVGLHSEKINMEKDRYRLLFSFENLWGIFCKSDNKECDVKSTDYDLMMCNKHDCMNPEDVLLDIVIMIRMGDLKVSISSVLAIRVHGKTYCYYLNRPQFADWTFDNLFTEIRNFFDDEVKTLIRKIHSNNMVLSVIDGRAHHIENINLLHTKVYAIDTEVYKLNHAIPHMGMVTYYNLFCLEEGKIVSVNPNNAPIQDIKNALYYFYNDVRFRGLKSRITDKMLVYDKQELKMILDFYDVQRMII